jgi:hypothetical protein
MYRYLFTRHIFWPDPVAYNKITAPPPPTPIFLRRLGLDPSELGIVSPYRKQTTKLRQMMTALRIDAANIRVGSVEEFQVTKLSYSTFKLETCRTYGGH